MRRLVVVVCACALVLACSSNPVAQEDKIPDQPFDSIAWNCQAGDSAVNGQLPFICP